MRLIYPPGMEWDIMVQRPHHLLRLAAAAGWKVTWWETGPYRPPREAAPGLRVVRSWPDAAAAGPFDVLYLTDPTQLIHLRPPAPPLLVYDRCDLRGAHEIPLLVRADLVLATTPGLAAQASKYSRRVVLLPNAADPDHFKPSHRAHRGDPPCIGYVGILAPHVDYSLLCDLIGARPTWRWLFAGQEKGGVSLPATAEVTRLGHVDYANLPGVLAEIDVGVVPFKDSPLTRAVDPIKVYEYLAAGKQVVATRLPHLAGQDWPIRLARTTDEWLVELDAAAAEASDFAAGREWAERNTWQRRAREFQKAIECLSA